MSDEYSRRDALLLGVRGAAGASLIGLGAGVIVPRTATGTTLGHDPMPPGTQEESAPDEVDMEVVVTASDSETMCESASRLVSNSLDALKGGGMMVAGGVGLLKISELVAAGSFIANLLGGMSIALGVVGGGIMVIAAIAFIIGMLAAMDPPRYDVYTFAHPYTVRLDPIAGNLPELSDSMDLMYRWYQVFPMMITTYERMQGADHLGLQADHDLQHAQLGLLLAQAEALTGSARKSPSVLSQELLSALGGQPSDLLSVPSSAQIDGIRDQVAGQLRQAGVAGVLADDVALALWKCMDGLDPGFSISHQEVADGVGEFVSNIIAEAHEFNKVWVTS